MIKIKRRNIKLCECGCGQPVNKNKQTEKYNNYLFGHQRIGRINSNQSNIKRSLSAKKIIHTNEWNNNVSKAKKGKTHLSPSIEGRENIGKSIKLIWENDSFRDKMYKIHHSEQYIENQSKKHLGLNTREKHWNWQGGERIIYPQKFNKQLKEKIRKRDDYICQVCLTSQDESLVKYKKKLDVHHIDYDKENCDEENLISLCVSCHMKTNKDREKWKSVFASQ